MYANEFAAKNGKLRVDCMFVTNGKSDAFLASCDGEYFLLDGGNKNTVSLEKLLEVRAELLSSYKGETENIKLKLNLVVSHFHVDHVTALYLYILPNKYIEINNVYLGVASVLGKSDDYDTSKNGDLSHRVYFLEALEKYQQQATLNYIDFKEKKTVIGENKDLRLDFYGSTEDWGKGDIRDPSYGIGYIRHNYYAKRTEEDARFWLSIASVNSNCMWCKITLKQKSFLFVGDIFKKLVPELIGEPMDRFLEFYGFDEFKCDVLKFTHHGHHREAASLITTEHMKPEHVIFTTDPATSAPDMDKANIKWYNSAFEPFYFETDGENLKVSIESHKYEYNEKGKIVSRKV